MVWLVGILGTLGTVAGGAGFLLAWRESGARRIAERDRDRAISESEHWLRQYETERQALINLRRSTGVRIKAIRAETLALHRTLSQCRDALPTDDAIDLANRVLALSTKAAERYGDQISDLHRSSDSPAPGGEV